MPAVTLGSLNVSNASGLVLSGDATINGDVVMAGGHLYLGSNTLTIGTSGSINGSSSSRFVVAPGPGKLRKMYSGIGSFTYPVGDTTGTAEYSPITLNFTSGSFSSAYADVYVRNTKHPYNPSLTNLVNRYWTVSQSGMSSFSCSVAADYVPADVVGAESAIFTGKWDGTRWSRYAAADTSLHRLSGTVTSFSDFTGGTGRSMNASVTVNLKAFIEGPFNGASAMNTILIPDIYDTSSVVLPLAHPYGAGYGGSPSHMGSENVPSMKWFTDHSDIVDWVLVEARATDGYTTQQTRAAFLKSDGSVVEIDGVSPVGFDSVAAGWHYYVLRHRNHLAIMTADSVNSSISTPLHDLSASLSNIYGNDAKLLSPGIYGMMSGDGNADGGVDVMDRINVWLPDNGMAGYLYGDYNLDGGVDVSDRISCWLPNNGNGSQVP
jgi:hypothetical protein